MATIEIHPPIFPIMQIKQSGSYITHSSWFYYRIRRVSDNTIVYTAFANSQAYGANNHPAGSYIQLAPGMYEWEIHNLSKSRAILQAFIMRSDNNNQRDGVVASGGSNNPQNAVCYSQVQGGKKIYMNFQVQEYAPGGTQWYHINASFWFINVAGDAYTLDAPNNTVGYYSTDISTITTTDNGITLTWNNPEQTGASASLPNTLKISTTAGGEVDNPFYIVVSKEEGGSTGGDTGGSTTPATTFILLDAYNLFNRFVNQIGHPLFRRNAFTYDYLNPSLNSFDTFGEVISGKKAWYKGSNTALGFIGVHEDMKFSNSTPNTLVVRHGDTTSIVLRANIGQSYMLDYTTSKYGIYIKKLSSDGDIRVKLEKSSAPIMLDVTITDTEEHFYSVPFTAVGGSSSYLTTLTISKGSMAFNADNLISVGFSADVNYVDTPTIDLLYRQYEVGKTEFEDCTDPTDFMLGVNLSNSTTGVVWLGKLTELSLLDIDNDSFYVFVKKISTGDIIAIFKYPEETI